MRNVFLLLLMVIFCLAFLNSCLVREKRIRANEGLNLTDSERKILFERANQGDTEASYRLSLYYDFYVNNFDEAYVWLKKAAEAGHISAQHDMAVDAIAKKNYDLAFYWYSRAVEGGDVITMVSLAKLYEAGRGTGQDFHKAEYWYERAAHQGDITAMLKMAEFLSEGKGGERNNMQAYVWLLTAGDRIHPGSVTGKEVGDKKKRLSEILSPAEIKQAEKESEILSGQIKR